MAIDPLSLDFGRDKPFYVYLYRDPRRGKKLQPIYVGKGKASRNRADKHWRHQCDNPLLERVLEKIRTIGLEPVIEIVRWFDNESEAFELECALVAKFGRRNQGNGPLCNLTNGGEGLTGYRASPETRALLAALWLGRKHTEETKAKMSAWQRGVSKGPISQAARDKMSLARKGRRHPPTAIENMSLAKKLSWANNPNQGTTGRRHSEEALAKMRAAWVKRRADPSTREKMIEAWAKRDREEFGKKMRAVWDRENYREEVCAKRRENPSFAGRKHSEEAKAKIRAARAARKVAD